MWRRLFCQQLWRTQHLILEEHSCCQTLNLRHNKLRGFDISAVYKQHLNFTFCWAQCFKRRAGTQLMVSIVAPVCLGKVLLPPIHDRLNERRNVCNVCPIIITWSDSPVSLSSRYFLLSSKDQILSWSSFLVAALTHLRKIRTFTAAWEVKR